MPAPALARRRKKFKKVGAGAERFSSHGFFNLRRRRRPPRLETGDSQSAVSAPLFSMMHTQGGSSDPPILLLCVNARALCERLQLGRQVQHDVGAPAQRPGAAVGGRGAGLAGGGDLELRRPAGRPRLSAAVTAWARRLERSRLPSGVPPTLSARPRTSTLATLQGLLWAAAAASTARPSLVTSAENCSK